MRVALAQVASGTDKAANLAGLRQAVADAAAAGAELVVCPEAAMHGFGRPDAPLAPVAEPLDGPFVTGLAELAGTHGVMVLAGMFERAPGEAARAYNTVVAVGPSGLLGGYRKVHLFDALGWRESDRLVAGDPRELLVLDVGGFAVGVLTCYDLRFPEVARALVDAGADLLALPAAWVAGPGKTAQWRALVTARAIENTAYVAAAGQPGPDYAGASALVDPAGEVLVEMGNAPGCAVGETSRTRLAEVRRRLPLLAHRRFTVVVR